MRLFRTYHPELIKQQPPFVLDLSEESYHHLCRVLRLPEGEEIHVVDGSGGHYVGKLTNIKKKSAQVAISDYVQATNEPLVQIHLVQGISKGDRMELTIQKAVELGVNEITPVFTKRGEVRLNEERLEKKMRQWHAIMVNACLQCYRDTIPTLNPPVSLENYLKQVAANQDRPVLHARAYQAWQSYDQQAAQIPNPEDNVNYQQLYINLNPFAGVRLKQIAPQTYQRVTILVGSEGGLDDEEISKAQEAGFTDFNLGPRVLRTETTGLAAIAILQSHLGDL
ncbi:16S rRNA (uracil(1498)-N(3))-methyltransferase [Psittacicella hinzii]|uniref:Ribosomal RNA small subunit methyltransferase E n=1 Tax=Psittacicella hinzii TaxID=2028575 RepID=A0A3A1YTX6_9GAMM|nr:16S rRNA (uracil(1498)-N(3))-methyltransferase [Psittacicella hinzii]RIY40330.1 16S rRNA (uracil(1498)-N(3))-methyltransferase [Psittacicella hinzii]